MSNKNLGLVFILIVLIGGAVLLYNKKFSLTKSTSEAALLVTIDDPLLANQWHLKDRAQEPGGANVVSAWGTSQGEGVVIGIVDDGVQYTHPDLSANYLASASWDFNFNDADAQPYATSSHGTAIAGVAAARGGNSLGVTGVAPLAQFAVLRLTASPATDSQEAAAFNFQPNTIHILSNSWNPTDNGLTIKKPGPLAEAAIKSAITSGRSGKGRIFVWSAGAGRLNSDSCGYDGYASSRYAIAVGGMSDAGNQVPTSEACSALMVVAPSAGGTDSLTTTDLVGTAGLDPTDYTSALAGMSGGVPTVSGTVALMLAKNPSLTWRDVQHILRRTSVRILPTDAGWTAGSYPHNERFGFGLVDAAAAVNEAAQWSNVSSEIALSPVAHNINLPIPDVNTAGLTDTITIPATGSNFEVEHVEVDINVTHSWRGDLQVKLTSPSGVVSTLPFRPNDAGDNLNLKFSSVRHWGESATGDWKLTVSDMRFQNTGTWDNWTLRIYGNDGTVTEPQPDLTLSATPSSATVTAGQPTSFNLNVSPVNGYTGSGNFTVAGLPANTTSSFSSTTYSGGSGSSTLNLTTTANTPTGSFPITVTAKDASGNPTKSAVVTLVVNAATVPDFNLSAVPTTRTIKKGQSTTYVVTLTKTGGFNEAVAFTATGCPLNATCTFSPATLSGTVTTTTLTVATKTTTPRSKSTINIKGTSPSKTKNINVTLTVK